MCSSIKYTVKALTIFFKYFLLLIIIGVNTETGASEQVKNLFNKEAR